MYDSDILQNDSTQSVMEGQVDEQDEKINEVTESKGEDGDFYPEEDDGYAPEEEGEGYAIENFQETDETLEYGNLNTGYSTSPPYASYAPTGCGSNIYAQPFSLSMDPDEQQKYIYNDGSWKMNDYYYTPHMGYPGSINGVLQDPQPRGTFEPQYDNKKENIYYPKQRNLLYENQERLSHGQPIHLIEPWRANMHACPTLTSNNLSRKSKLDVGKPYDALFTIQSLKTQIELEIEDANKMFLSDADLGVGHLDLNPYYGLQSLSRELNNGYYFFGYHDAVYRAFSSKTNLIYSLRRFKGFNVYGEGVFSNTNKWIALYHPNIVNLKEAFTTKAFGDDSLVFVYEYIPLAMTLEAKREHLISTTGNPNTPEKDIWSYISQIVCALKAIHSANLAARVIHEHNILISNDGRIRIGSCGIAETMINEPQADLKQAQDKDLYALGRLIVYLTTGIDLMPANVSNTLEIISKSYSQEVTSLILYLIARSHRQRTLSHVIILISQNILNNMQFAYSYNDLMMSNLKKEIQNGRLVRILCKLGFINERPEFAMDPNWSETGDRYLVKLFRDFIFHQVDENMRPVVDLGRVIHNLNKLDFGVDEKIMLSSRDDDSSLIVSYKELKRCVEKSFNQLLAG